MFTADVRVQVPPRPPKEGKLLLRLAPFSFSDSKINKTGSMASVCGIAVEPVAVRPAWAKSNG